MDPEDLIFRDKTGVVRLVIEQGGRITVTRGYAWNGCSPKICVFDLLLGTPEGVVHVRTGKPKTYYASLVHDALYQFLPDGLPLGRRHADRFFLLLLAESEFALRWLYWGAVAMVSVFGTMAADVTHVVLGVPYGISTAGFAALVAALLIDRKSTRLNSSHSRASRMPSSA